MTFEQLKWFEAFLKYDCAQASGFFTIPLNPISQPTTLRFTAYPQLSFDTSKGVWVVTGSVEYVRAAPTGTAGASLPTFPPTLPFPEQENYTINRAGTVSRSNLEEGLASQRARFKDEVALVQMEWKLNADEYAVFDSFVHDTLLGGLAPFIGPFSNGLGPTNVRINFIAPPQVQSDGAAYTVTAQAEVRDIPTISEFVYRGYGTINIADSITWDAEVFAEIGTSTRDQFSYQDNVTFSVGKYPNDSIGYTESVSFVLNMNRAPVENITFDDSVLSFRISKIVPTEYLVFTTQGKACFEDYATNYVQFGYDQLCNVFSAEETANDQISYSETISLGFTGFRTFNENMTFSTGGGIVGNTYCAPDYVGFGYTADTLASFTN